MRELARRLLQCVVGLVIFGLGVALMARGQLGLGPWSVLHDGIGRQAGLPLGTVEILLGIPILAAWIPLQQRAGIGTVLNVFILGLSTNVGLKVVAPATVLQLQGGLMVAGTLLVGFGAALYLSSDLGPGPRDGLMTGLQTRFGWHIAPVRTGIEIGALVVGSLLGGAVGLGTVAYAVTIGPVLAVMLNVFGAGHMVRRAPSLPRTGPPVARKARSRQRRIEPRKAVECTESGGCREASGLTGPGDVDAMSRPRPADAEEPT